MSQNFYRALRIVAHPPGNLQQMGLPLYEPAKSDALNAAANDEPASMDGKLLFCGSHLGKVKSQKSD